MEKNAIGWVEIPVSDMDRAKAFYETVFDREIQVHAMGDLIMGWFPYVQGKEGASGSLVQHPDFYRPSESHGPVVYFTSSDVQIELDRVEAAGGRIIQSKTQISEAVGFMALFRDSEGNRIALHSNK
ncbi:MAG: VOC family protein [Robiginitalea sp.]|jgi:predicted enzyme related to lactoylglutathione lyase